MLWWINAEFCVILGVIIQKHVPKCIYIYILLVIKMTTQWKKQIQKNIYCTQTVWHPDKMFKFVRNLVVYRDSKVEKQLPHLAAKTACTCLGMESNCAWMAEMDNTFHAASSLRHILSTVLAEEGCLVRHSSTND